MGNRFYNTTEEEIQKDQYVSHTRWTRIPVEIKKDKTEINLFCPLSVGTTGLISNRYIADLIEVQKLKEIVLG